MFHFRARIVLLALAFLASASPALAQTTVTDTLDVSFTVETIYFTNVGGLAGVVGCRNYIVGVHADPLGEGLDSNYRYATFRDGSRLDRLRTSTNLPPEVDPGDIPGVRISSAYGGSGATTCRGEIIAQTHAFVPRLAGSVATYSRPEGPVALFNWEQTEGLTVRFDGTESRVATPSGRRPVSSFVWTHGDPATTAVTEHTFPEPGDYDVTLTVTDDDGNEDSMTQTVTVTGHQLTVKALPVEPDRLYSLGDTIVVETTVTNTGASSVLDVTVPPYTEALSDAPDSPPTASVAQPTLPRMRTREPEMRSVLGVGESIVTLDSFRVDRYGRYTLGGEVFLAEVRAWAEMPATIEASSETGDEVLIRRPCKGGACETFRVGPRELDVTVEFRKDNLVTFEGLAGLRYNPLLNSPRLEVQAFDYTADGEPFCSTACVDVLVEVTSEEGEPVAEAEVTLEAGAIPDTSNVTPDHTGGHFCTQEPGLSGWTCDNELTATADGDGKLRAIYSFPGVISDVEVPITVAAKEPSSSDAPTEVEETLRIRANVEHESTVRLNRSQAGYLTASALTVIGGTIASPMGEVCESILKGIADPSVILQPSDSPILFSVANATAEWACAFNPLSLWSETVPGNAKKVGETNVFLQFDYLHRPPSRGLFTMSAPRPGPLGVPIVTADGDYYADVIGAMTQAVAQDLIREGTTIKVTLTEVSWMRELTTLVGRLEVFAMHLRIDVTAPSGETKRFDSLLQNQYMADLHLLPPTGRARLRAVVSAREEKARLQDLVDRVNEGDYLLFLDSDPLKTETSQVSDASVEGRVAASKAGDVEQTVGLVAPLRFDHDADTWILVIEGSGAATVPAAPLVMSADTLGTMRAYPFRWFTGLAPASRYQIEIARDTLFADVVESDAEVSGQEFIFQATTDNETLYWRVRGVNGLGEGPWSRRGRVEVIDAVSTSDTPDEVALPEALMLSVYPNPASGSARLAVEAPTSGRQRVVLFDALGRQLALVADGDHPAGRHELAIQVSGLPAGVYVLRAEAGGEAVMQRFTVVR